MQELLTILKKRAKPKPSHGFQAEVATLSLFDGKASKVGEFVRVCNLYLRMKMRGTIIKDLEVDILEFEIMEKFLKEIKIEFKGGNKKLKKIAKLKELEQSL